MLPHGTGRERARRRLRRGRQGARGRGGRRGHRRLGRPRQADRGGLHRLRRRDRDARPDGQRRPARPRARPPRPDAEPEDRHGDDGRRQGRARGEGRQARVPHRPRRERPHPDRQASFDERALVENYAALLDEIVRAKPAAPKGRYIKKITLASTMGPGIHVDPSRTRGHRRGAGPRRPSRRQLRKLTVSRQARRRRQMAARTAARSPSEVASWEARPSCESAVVGGLDFMKEEVECRKMTRNASLPS